MFGRLRSVLRALLDQYNQNNHLLILIRREIDIGLETPKPNFCWNSVDTIICCPLKKFAFSDFVYNGPRERKMPKPKKLFNMQVCDMNPDMLHSLEYRGIFGWYSHTVFRRPCWTFVAVINRWKASLSSLFSTALKVFKYFIALS